MNRPELESEMKTAQWSKDRCVSFALRCARSLVDFSPDPSVVQYLQQIEEYQSSGFSDSEKRKLVNSISRSVAVLRIKNEGRAREVCHATLHASETALANGSIYGQASRAWAAVNAADPELGSQLLLSEGIEQ